MEWIGVGLLICLLACVSLTVVHLWNELRPSVSSRGRRRADSPRR